MTIRDAFITATGHDDCLATTSKVKLTPAATVDKSAIFQRLRDIKIWLEAERLIGIERKRLRAEGKSRAEAGNCAWKLASAEFCDEAVILGSDLRSLLFAPPPDLSVEQAVAWKLAIATIGITTQRSQTLTRTATALITQIRLRLVMEIVGEYALDESHIGGSLKRLKGSSATCVAEVDRIISQLASISSDSWDDERIDELSEILNGLSLARNVLELHWSSTSFAVRSV